MNYLLRLLPPWPVVPPRLWLTITIIVLASLNLIFKEEIWPNTPHAALVGDGILLLTLLVAIPQIIWMLWTWPAAYTGPWWAGGLFRIAVTCASGTLLLLELLVGIWWGLDFLARIFR